MEKIVKAQVDGDSPRVSAGDMVINWLGGRVYRPRDVVCFYAVSDEYGEDTEQENNTRYVDVSTHTIHIDAIPRLVEDAKKEALEKVREHLSASMRSHRGWFPDDYKGTTPIATHAQICHAEDHRLREYIDTLLNNDELSQERTISPIGEDVEMCQKMTDCDTNDSEKEDE